MGSSSVSAATCAKQFDTTTYTGYIPYGSDEILTKFCLPNSNKLPTEEEFKDFTEQYNNIIGDFGLDDIQTIL